MEETIVLSRREVHGAAVLEEVARKSMTLRDAAEYMRISYRQAKRMNRRYEREGLHV